MAYTEFAKNKTDTVRVKAYSFSDYELVDVRIWSTRTGEAPTYTRKGLSINVDQVPDLIQALRWALQQAADAPEDAPERAPAAPAEMARLADSAHAILSKAGTPLHWDMLESMVFDGSISDATKWDLHYSLVAREDLFEYSGDGCFGAK